MATFTVGQQIGRGQYSQVFRGKYKDSEVAIKRILMNHLEAEKMDGKYDAWKQLDHPNILKLFHFEEKDPFRFLVFSRIYSFLELMNAISCLILELCVGTLAHFICGEYADYMPPQQQCLLQMAAGVQHMHSNNIVHGNVNPENVLICAIDGWVRLKMADFSADSISNKTIRSLQYLAPEMLILVDKDQVQTEWQVPQMTNASDVFALGCVFFKFLTKTHPFGTENIISNVRNGRLNLSGTLTSPDDKIKINLKIKKLIKKI